MSALVVEPMNDATQWTALQADGVTPSVDLTIADDATLAGHGPDGVSQLITASAAATGHMLRRSLASVDISGFSELRLSMRSDRRAGETDLPFFLELRVASAAIPLGDPNNTWRRLLPVAAERRWETVKLSLDDLPAGISTAVDTIQLRCVSADPPFTVNIDDVTAVQPEMIADAGRALEGRLSGIVVGGTPVPALVRSAAEPLPAAPALDIVNTDIQYAPARLRDMEVARDFTGDGLRLVPLGEPYDLYYSITPLSTTSDENAAMIEAVLSRIAPFDELNVDGDRQTIEAVWLPREDRPLTSEESPVLYYKLAARRAGAVHQSVHRVEALSIRTDQR